MIALFKLRLAIALVQKTSMRPHSTSTINLRPLFYDLFPLQRKQKDALLFQTARNDCVLLGNMQSDIHFMVEQTLIPDVQKQFYESILNQ